MNRIRFAGLVFMFLLSCTGEKGRGPELIFSPFYQDDFYSFPFPSDFRRKEDGKIDMDGYPAPPGVQLLEMYKTVAARELNGFGNNSPVYFTFTGKIDTETLPQAPDESLADSSSLFMVNVDTECFDTGIRVPVIWHYQPDETDYIRAGTLAVSPMWGFPLSGGCVYAVVMTDGVKDTEGRRVAQAPLLRLVLRQVETTDSVINSLKEVYKPLVQFIKAQKKNKIENIVAATVFRTQDPVDELVRIRDYFNDNYSPVLKEIAYTPATTDYYQFEGKYTSPNLQYGEPPYRFQDGQFVFTQDGEPVIQREEELRFALTVPNNSIPPNGFPIAMYAHGTGGDYKSFIRDGTADNLTKRGIAVVSIDQPIHGPRGTPDTEVEWDSFNFLNPDSGRAIFRQSVVDSMILTKLIKSGALFVDSAISPTGSDIYFDADKILFMGHSHGGITGSMFISLNDDVKSAVLSGAGGGLSLTILQRKDPDIEALLRPIVGLDPSEELNTFHPIIGLAQLLVEITDPINYSPFYFHKLLTTRSRNVLVTEGLLDQQTPASTTEALAIAAGIPQVEPIARDVEGLILLGLFPLFPPVSNNIIINEARRVTAGLLQYSDGNHWVVFNNPAANEKAGYFLYSTAYEGVAVIS